jgi:hypothetical protein
VQKLARRVGEKRSGQTRLGAGISRWWAVAGLAAVLALGGWLLHRGLLGLASAFVQGLSRLTEMTWFQVPT